MWCSTYHWKWHDMYYPYRIVLPSNILKLIQLYIKQTWVHYPNLCAIGIHYQTFSKGWHQSLRFDINIQYHSPMFDINGNQESIPTIHQPNPIVWQSPSLALKETPKLMATLSHDNYPWSYSSSIEPYICYSLFSYIL